MNMDNNHVNSTNSGRTIPTDPNAAMQDMMNTIDALRDLYHEENEALATTDTKRFVSLQDRKIAMARDYQQQTQTLLARKKELKKIDPALKEKLTRKQAEFSEIAAENMAALDKVRKTVQRLNDRLMSLARDSARKDSVNYGARGDLGNAGRPLSIGVNESA